MANVQDVAKFFIDLAQKQDQTKTGDLMTQLRLQKLLFFAQGWFLARYGKPLFEAPILAWKYGPVVREIYDQYNYNGGNGISSDARIAPDALSSEELSLLLDVAREYNDVATPALVRKTHVKNGPWAQVRKNEVIPTQSVLDYFRTQEPLPSFDAELEKQQIITPARDEHGNAVFPAELDCDWGDLDAD